ncbi:DNA-binding NarL/FixJ family response regulator [Haloactinopolyspora alba]|uniref:DNA-binding NarL/FixJ family response regulator n=1 Tax=Haloactinopolyspora alba TaxID=648780 RepID=A0A2P8E3I1_9ACTN|nr:DNA-binding NarL/FixJ family response regulator [Haloactinopolyspora alba]
MVGELTEQGNAALASCDWSTARECFERAREVRETPEVLDGLGRAVYWQGEYQHALHLRERAYAGYRRRDDRRSAGLVAVQVAQLYGLISGNAAAVDGWLGHARRMLADGGDCVERGWLELFLGCVTSDPAERERRTRSAAAAGRRLRSPDLEFDALGYLGLARLEAGAVDEGMRLMDEAVAAVASGLVGDAWAAGEIYCTLFHGCEMVLDVRRAEQWMRAVDAYVERTGELPISAICRMHYGGLLMAAGRWDEADHELTEALRIYRNTSWGTRFEPLLRLADLRVRQGRFDEAERLMDGFEDHGSAAGPRARLLLVQGEPRLARSVVDRALGDGCWLSTAPMVALRVEVALACDAVDEARADADDLARLAADTDSTWLRGLAALSQARVMLAAADDPAKAQVELEGALAAFAESGLPFELATARLDLAALLVDTTPEVARSHARYAADGFLRLGARREADVAAHLLRRLGEPTRKAPRPDGVLTERQNDVLRLLAEGLSNTEIARRLVISPRTAEHHVGNILSALGLRSRAEAAAYLLRHPQQD